MLTDEQKREALEIADRAVLESMLEEGCSWADAIRAKIREAFAPARRAGGRERRIRRTPMEAGMMLTDEQALEMAKAAVERVCIKTGGRPVNGCALSHSDIDAELERRFAPAPAPEAEEPCTHVWAMRPGVAGSTYHCDKCGAMWQPEAEQPEPVALLEAGAAIVDYCIQGPGDALQWLRSKRAAAALTGVDLPRRYTEEDMNAERVRVQEETEAEVLARVEVPPEVVAVVEAAIEFDEDDDGLSDAPDKIAEAVDALRVAYPDGTWRQAIGGVQPEPVEVRVNPVCGKWQVRVEAQDTIFAVSSRKQRVKALREARWLASMLRELGVNATLREEGE